MARFGLFSTRKPIPAYPCSRLLLENKTCHPIYTGSDLEFGEVCLGQRSVVAYKPFLGCRSAQAGGCSLVDTIP